MTNIKPADEHGILTDPSDLEANEVSRRLAVEQDLIARKETEFNNIVEQYRAIFDKLKRPHQTKCEFYQQTLRHYANHQLKKNGKESGTVTLPYIELITRKGSKSTVANPDLLNQTPDITAELIAKGVITVVPETRRVNLPAAKRAKETGTLPEQVEGMVSVERNEPTFTVKIIDTLEMLKRSKLVELPEINLEEIE